MDVKTFVDIISPYGFLLLILGALVDIFQAFWIVKKFYRKCKRLVYSHVREELIKEMKGKRLE